MNIIGKSALTGVTGRFVQNRTLPEGGVSRMWGEEGASDMTGQSMAVGGRGWRGSCARLKNGDRWSGTGDRCGGYQPTWRPRRYRQVGADTGGGEADPGGACSRRSSPSKPTIARFRVRIALRAVKAVTSRTGGLDVPIDVQPNGGVLFRTSKPVPVFPNERQEMLGGRRRIGGARIDRDITKETAHPHSRYAKH
jgi:hypothetical protein